MDPSTKPKPLFQFTDPFAIVVDLCLIGAIVAAYLPQIRHLRKSTIGETPSIDGLSPFYIFSHGLFCNLQLSLALLRSWDADLPTKLSTFDAKLCVAQFLAQWICAMAIVATYVVGRSKQIGGKVIIPLLLLIHAFVFVFLAWVIVNSPRDYSLTTSSSTIGAILILLDLSSTWLTLLLQFCAQYWELRKMSDYGALNLRSCCMQAAVMVTMAIRLFIKFGFNFEGVPEGKDLGFFWWVFANVLWLYYRGFASFNLLLWVGGAAIIYFATRASKKGVTKENIELGVVLH